GGEYDFKFGAVKGRKKDPWRFSDFSTHPGTGKGGVTTAAGLYQITKPTWHDHGENGMGLTDFTPETQDLIAVSILRRRGVIDKIKEGDIEAGVSQASRQWAALPMGRGQSGRYKQPYVQFEHFEAVYKSAGGTSK
ncbi:paar repeat-containing protein, partial [bacterium]|nr:paar repeat-containing protein [bacterium]